MSDLRRPDREEWLDRRAAGGLRHRLLVWEGNGPLLLFSHAASLCAGAWAPVLAHLPPDVCAIGFDQRGHGDTDAPDGDEDYRWSLFGEDFIAVVETVTRTFGRSPDACITHSFAGDCAMIALAEHRSPVGRMILLDPVLADQEGATVGAERLARGTVRLGEKESGGFGSRDEVGEGLERVLRAQLEREGLSPAAKAAFAEYGSAPDNNGRLQLKCRRENEARVYRNRVAIADHLRGRRIDAPVDLIFAARRRAKPEDQAAAYARDWAVAEGVVGPAREGRIHRLDGVGHFLVLEAPELVAETIGRHL